MVFLGLHRIFNKWKVLWPEQFSTFWLSKSQKIWLPSDLLHLWGRTSPIEVVGLQIVDGPRCPSFPMFWCVFSWDYLPNNIEKTTKPGFLRMCSCFPKKNVWISSDFSQEIWICLGIFRHFRCLSGALSYRGSKDLSVVGEVADVRLHGGPSAVGGLWEKKKNYYACIYIYYIYTYIYIIYYIYYIYIIYIAIECIDLGLHFGIRTGVLHQAARVSCSRDRFTLNANLVNSIGFMVEISRTSFHGVKLNQRNHITGGTCMKIDRDHRDHQKFASMVKR